MAKAANSKKGVVILSPGFNPNIKKYKCCWGRYHVSKAVWAIMIVELMMAVLHAGIGIMIFGSLSFNLNVGYVLLAAATFFICRSIVLIIAIFGIMQEYRRLILVHLCYQIFCIVAFVSLGLALIYFLLFARIGLEEALLQSASIVESSLEVGETEERTSTRITDPYLAGKAVGLAAYFCVASWLEAIVHIWFFSIVLGFYRFLRDNRRHRTRVHAAVVLEGMPPYPQTPATPIQPSLDPMKGFYGDANLLSVDRDVEQHLSPSPSSLTEIPITPLTRTAQSRDRSPSFGYFSHRKAPKKPVATKNSTQECSVF